MSKIVVTGGSGFIGRATAKYAFDQGYEVRVFDRSNGDDILGDLSRLNDADHVIHLAGVLGTSELFDTPEEAIQNNVVGSLRIMEKCLAEDATYTGISMPQVFPSVYTATKVCATRLATAWNKFRDLPVSHVRAFNAFGPGQAHGHGHPQKILPTFATEAWNGRPIPIWGDGTQTVDLVHVDDLARMLVDAIRFGNDEVFDGGTGVSMTVTDVAEWVNDITGNKAGITYLPMRDGEEKTSIVAEGEGWDLLGWKPELDEDKFVQSVYAYKP